MLLTVNSKTCTIKLPNRPTTFCSTVIKPYLLDPQDSIKPRESIKLAKPVPSPAEPQPLPKAKAEPQLPPKRGRGRPYKYPLFTAVADTVVTDAIIDTGAFTGNIVENDSNTQFSAS